MHTGKKTIGCKIKNKESAARAINIKILVGDRDVIVLIGIKQ
ncbi:hypothetical protein [Pseudobacteroides cellulosolvens]|nr:hypothetical protein [Pseudobacteroides cellulosolvens]